MTSDTTWTLIGLGLCVLVLTMCGVAVLLETRARQERRPVHRQRCPRCGDPGVLHMGAHLHLAHGERAWAAEDGEEWQ